MVDSFFEKLKKGMGIETPQEKVISEELPKKKRVKQKIVHKISTPAPILEPKVEKKIMIEEPEIVEEKIEISKPVVKPPIAPIMEKEEIQKEKTWFEPEGELAIDVYQTETELVIQSAIAGVRPEFLDISMERDIITIKGVREKPFEEEGDYFTQECYWGSFSREVILPVEVDPDRAEASMKEGILTIRIPKILREKKRVIKVRA